MENEPNKEKYMENKAEPNMEMADVRRRKYNREYYHEHKAPVKCEYCGKRKGELKTFSIWGVEHGSIYAIKIREYEEKHKRFEKNEKAVFFKRRKIL